jgi:transcriptional regulator with XRE-family HTH domain
MTENKDPIDRLVGQRVRILRVNRGLSQSALASQLGLTFQQVQKYEKGTNRISASMLYEIGRILGVEVVSLFQDASDPEMRAIVSSADVPSRTDLQIVRKLSLLPESRVKGQFIKLVLALADRAAPITEN